MCTDCPRTNHQAAKEKDALLEMLEGSLESGNTATEDACRFKLAEVATDAREWDEAMVSIGRLRELRVEVVTGGPWMHGDETFETFDTCKQATAYLHAGLLLDALRCFEKSWIRRFVFSGTGADMSCRMSVVDDLLYPPNDILCHHHNN
jgi:hypothetical protein